jgi:hypothetical protein
MKFDRLPLRLQPYIYTYIYGYNTLASLMRIKLNIHEANPTNNELNDHCLREAFE